MTTLLTMKGFNKKIDYLCFTANTAGSTVKLNKLNNPPAISLEISTDYNVWSAYTIGTTITLSNVGDKVYFRNNSTTTTQFSTNGNQYRFAMTGSIAASGDITYLVNKNGTKDISGCGEWCFLALFYSCTALTSCPTLNATTLSNYCYYNLFYGCSNLETLPKLPATTIPNGPYQNMFQWCSKIKISSTQGGEYQTPYRIPTEGTGTALIGALANMFQYTGGTLTGTPTVNTTYYTSNTLV